MTRKRFRINRSQDDPKKVPYQKNDMAESSLSSTISEDFLTCSICLEIFKEPKILPCLHTFCLCCLSKLVDGSSSNILRCPKCRNETPLPERGTLGLTTNFYIVNLTEVVQDKGDGHNAALCCFCITKGDNAPAFFKCLDCQDLLCKTCSDIHTLTRLTINHRIVDLSEVRNGKYDDQIRSSQGILCSVHEKEKIQYFCATCDKPVCRDCVLLSHKLHECMTIEDALKFRIGKIRVLMKEVEDCLKNHKDDAEMIKKQFEEFRTEESQLYSIANELSDRVIEDVHRQRKEVKEKITQCFMKPKEEALEKIQKRTNTTKNLTESLEFCKSILQNGKDVEILALEELLRKRLTELQSIPRDPKAKTLKRKSATLKLASTIEGNQKIFLFSEITSADKAVQKLSGKEQEDSSKSTLQCGNKSHKAHGDIPSEIFPAAKLTMQGDIKTDKTPEAKYTTKERTLESKQMSQDGIETEITSEANPKTQDEQQRHLQQEVKHKTLDGKPRETTIKRFGDNVETNVKLVVDLKLCRKKVHKLKYIKTFNNVRENSRIKPKLTSVAWLNNSSFTVADNNNDLIYTLDLSGKILAKTPVLKPLTMTVCNGIIVCFSGSHLNIVQPSGKILQKEMHKGYKIFPVATKGDNFLVGNIKQGVITEFSGTSVVKSITINNEKNEKEKSDCFALCANEKGYIAVSYRGSCRILLVREDGQFVNRVNTNEDCASRPKWEPNTIAIDQHENVFSVCYESSRLIVFSIDGGYISVSDFENKLVYPRSIAVYGDNMLVTDSNGYIYQFLVQYK
ncbi:hypothetical protein KUTeg_001184 [Tegillarca granosa]|uniref:Uncharacterized protein n=1 Tax=Tegillarca granosa TaxID=220873 RepID=A0ABQ9FYX2_TEGGR|nr:hypothetical protein KUTeg_001184 [Tegillarca granosa]